MGKYGYLFNNSRLHQFIYYCLRILAETFTLPSLGIGRLKKQLRDRIIRIFAGALTYPKIHPSILFFIHFYKFFKLYNSVPISLEFALTTDILIYSKYLMNHLILYFFIIWICSARIDFKLSLYFYSRYIYMISLCCCNFFWFIILLLCFSIYFIASSVSFIDWVYLYFITSWAVLIYCSTEPKLSFMLAICLSHILETYSILWCFLPSIEL